MLLQQMWPAGLLASSGFKRRSQTYGELCCCSAGVWME